MTSMVATYSDVAEPYTVAAEVLHAGHAQQRERAGHLGPEDVCSPLHTAFTAGHQSVEVGAADEGGAGPQGHRGDDVAAGEDAAVDVHLGTVTHRVHRAGQHFQ